MNLPDSLISYPAFLLSGSALLIALWLGLSRAPWRALPHQPARLHLVLACISSLTFLWLLRADTLPGLSWHFLGLTAVTLIIGWPLALLSGFVALLLLAGLGHAGWSGSGIGIDFWGMVAPPVAITTLVSHSAQRYLPANFFIYLFVDVFLSALLGVFAAALASAGLVIALDLYTWDTLWQSYLPLVPLQAVPEGIVNAMIMTGLTLLIPQWVISFDERRYFSSS